MIFPVIGTSFFSHFARRMRVLNTHRKSDRYILIFFLGLFFILVKGYVLSSRYALFQLKLRV